jgi:predicted RNase H-like HicB family nuclease
MMRRQLTAIIEREGSGYVSFCPELDIASQGKTITDTRDNLKEALERHPKKRFRHDYTRKSI